MTSHLQLYSLLFPCIYSAFSPVLPPTTEYIKPERNEKTKKISHGFFIFRKIRRSRCDGRQKMKREKRKKNSRRRHHHEGDHMFLRIYFYVDRFSFFFFFLRAGGILSLAQPGVPWAVSLCLTISETVYNNQRETFGRTLVVVVAVVVVVAAKCAGAHTISSSNGRKKVEEVATKVELVVSAEKARREKEPRP